MRQRIYHGCLVLSFFVVPIIVLPFLSEPYGAPKWLYIYLATLLAACINIFQPESFHWPLLGRNTRWLICLGVFGLLAAIGTRTPNISSIARLSSFFVLAVSCCAIHQGFPRLLINIGWANAVSTAAILVVGFLQLMGLNVLTALPLGEFPDATFGYQNLTAEFMGLSVLFQWYLLANQERARNRRYALLALLLLSHAYLLILGCRAVVLGLLLATAILYRQFVGLRRVVAIGLASIALIGATFWFVGSNHPRYQEKFVVLRESLWNSKRINGSLRLTRWANTIRMILDNPLGVGLGQFTFSYLPYNDAYKLDVESTEDSVVDSPHNEYLQFFVEAGWLAGCVFLFLIFSFVRRLWILGRSDSEEGRESSFIVVVAVYCATVGLFAFPTANPSVFLALAILAGCGLALCFPVSSVPIPRIAYALLLAAVSYEASGLATSNFTELNSGHDYQTLSVVCRLFPSKWRVCVKKARFEFNIEEYEDAQKTTQKILAREPNNYPAMKILALADLKTGHVTRACETLHKYHQFFGGQSSLAGTFKGQCQTKMGSLNPTH